MASMQFFPLKSKNNESLKWLIKVSTVELLNFFFPKKSFYPHTPPKYIGLTLQKNNHVNM